MSIDSCSILARYIFEMSSHRIFAVFYAFQGCRSDKVICELSEYFFPAGLKATTYRTHESTEYLVPELLVQAEIPAVAD